MELRYSTGELIKAGDWLSSVEGQTSRVVVVYPTHDALEGYNSKSSTSDGEETGVLVEHRNASGRHLVHYPTIDENFELLVRATDDGHMPDAVLEDSGSCAWYKGLTMKDDPRQSYVLGHGSEEHRRLMLQSRFVGELTEAVFARAGLVQGMRVLDVGCGAGDVSLLAAAFVGVGGSVLGIDQSPESATLARERAKAAGLDNVRFEVARLEEFREGGPFDALVGRLVLLYLKEPAVVLRQLAELVRPDGVIVFQEMEMTTARCVPESPLWTQTGRWIVEAFTRAGVETSMGSRMYSVFKDAGLPAPEMIDGGRVEGNPESQIFEWLAQTVRSLLPMIEKTGVATRDEVGIDTLADRLRAAVVERNGVAHSPIFVGAWTRKP